MIQKNLRIRILFEYIILMAVIGSMAAILIHERERMREIELDRQQPDFSALLAFGDRRHTLERLVAETKKEMDEVRKAAEAKDMEALDGWVHHLRSSWMLMKTEQPLQELYAVIHSDSPTDGEIAHAVQKVLEQGKLIVDLARKEAERWEE